MCQCAHQSAFPLKDCESLNSRYSVHSVLVKQIEINCTVMSQTVPHITTHVSSNVCEKILSGVFIMNKNECSTYHCLLLGPHEFENLLFCINLREFSIFVKSSCI